MLRHNRKLSQGCPAVMKTLRNRIDKKPKQLLRYAQILVQTASTQGSYMQLQTAFPYIFFPKYEVDLIIKFHCVQELTKITEKNETCSLSENLQFFAANWCVCSFCRKPLAKVTFFPRRGLTKKNGRPEKRTVRQSATIRRQNS